MHGRGGMTLDPLPSLCAMPRRSPRRLYRPIRPSFAFVPSAKRREVLGESHEGWSCILLKNRLSGGLYSSGRCLNFSRVYSHEEELVAALVFVVAVFSWNKSLSLGSSTPHLMVLISVFVRSIHKGNVYRVGAMLFPALYRSCALYHNGM